MVPRQHKGDGVDPGRDRPVARRPTGTRGHPSWTRSARLGSVPPRLLSVLGIFCDCRPAIPRSYQRDGRVEPRQRPPSPAPPPRRSAVNTSTVGWTFARRASLATRTAWHSWLARRLPRPYGTEGGRRRYPPIRVNTSPSIDSVSWNPSPSRSHCQTNPFQPRLVSRNEPKVIGGTPDPETRNRFRILPPKAHQKRTEWRTRGAHPGVPEAHRRRPGASICPDRQQSPRRC